MRLPATTSREDVHCVLYEELCRRFGVPHGGPSRELHVCGRGCLAVVAAVGLPTDRDLATLVLVAF